MDHFDQTDIPEHQLTATQMLAVARGVCCVLGARRCFYCGGSCGDLYLASEFVKTSFSSRDTVCGGEYVCAGCVEAMQEKTTVQLVDGVIRESQRIRCYSWMVAEGMAVAATKAHRDWLLRQCSNPPQPPFVICLSDSGQRHLLYRSVVCHSREQVVVSLEGEVVRYAPEDLLARLALCRKMCSVVGKTALGSTLSLSHSMALCDAGIDITILKYWQTIWATGLTRLAVWLTPGKRECADGIKPCPPDRGTQPHTIQTAFSWAG